MTSFDKYLMDNYLLFNVAVALVNLILVGHLAQRLKSGFAMSALGLIAAVAISVIVPAIAVSIVGVFVMPSFLPAIAKSFIGAISWSLEAGGEFGILAIAAGIIGYLIVRMRLRRKLAET